MTLSQQPKVAVRRGIMKTKTLKNASLAILFSLFLTVSILLGLGGMVNFIALIIILFVSVILLALIVSFIKLDFLYASLVAKLIGKKIKLSRDRIRKAWLLPMLFSSVLILAFYLLVCYLTAMGTDRVGDNIKYFDLANVIATRYTFLFWSLLFLLGVFTQTWSLVKKDKISFSRALMSVLVATLVFFAFMLVLKVSFINALTGGL